MKKLMNSALLIACVLLPLLSTGNDQAEMPPCMFPVGDVCETERFEMRFQNNSGPEEYCNRTDGKYCVLLGQFMPEPIPPAPAWLHCITVDSYSQRCTVWPQGDMHFSWAVSAELETEQRADWSGASQRIFCREGHGSGTVSVTLTTPDGLAETVFFGVSCGTMAR